MKHKSEKMVELSVEQLQEVAGGRWVRIPLQETPSRCVEEEGGTRRCTSGSQLYREVWVD